MTNDAVARVRAADHWAFLRGGPLGTVRDEIGRLEAAGVHGVLVPQIYAPPWATLAVAAACSELQLHSGIAMGFVRSPFETAMAALDLDRLSGGRFTLGLGTSVQDWNERRFGVAYRQPVARLRELVLLVRRLVTAGEQEAVGRYDGEFWSLDLTGSPLPPPLRPTIPITVAPLRAAMTEMAAEVADGIIGHPVWTPDFVAGGMRTAVERGLERAGRDRRALRITACLRVAITDDVEQGRRDAKVGIPFYASLAQYDSYFADLGLGDDARRLQRLAAAGASATALADACSDALADALVVIGPPDEVAARIATVLDHVDDVCIGPPSGLPPDATRAYDDAIANHLLPGR